MRNKKYVKSFKSYLYEANENTERGKERVNIVTGRFQPFHKGHLKIAEDLYKKNGLPVVLVKVRKTDENSKTKLGKGTPFPYSLTDKMLDDIVKKYPYIKDHVEIEHVAFDSQLFPALRPKYEPVLFGAGHDRITGYNRQLKSFIKNNTLNLNPKFTIEETKRYGSATVVRNSIDNNNEKEYKKLMPRSLHKYFNELKITKK